jgi:hypothetical protein
MADNAAPPESNGKVTTREFYDQLMKINDRMDTMERRILSRIDEATRAEPPRLVQQVNTLERRVEKELECVQSGINNAHEEITALQIQSARNDKIVGVTASIVSSTVAALITWLTGRT